MPDSFVSKTKRSIESNKYLRALIADPFRFLQLYFILLFSQSLFFMTPDLQSYINYVFILWGTLIVGYNLIIAKSYKDIKVLRLFALAWGIAFLAILFNYEAGTTFKALKGWYLMILLYLLVLPLLKLTRRDFVSVLKGLLVPQIVLSFIAAIVSFCLGYLNIAGYIFRPDNGFYWGVRYVFRKSGEINPLLAGVYTDSNYSAIISFCSLVFSFIFLYFFKTIWVRCFLVLNIVVQTYFFILANSRGAYVAAGTLIVAIAVAGIVAVYKKQASWKFYAKNFGVFALLVVFIILAGNAVRSISYDTVLDKPIHRYTVLMANQSEIAKERGYASEVTKVDKKIVPLKRDYLGKPKAFLRNPSMSVQKADKAPNLNKVTATKQDSIQNNVDEIGNGRIGRWIQGFTLANERPLTGTTIQGAPYFVEKYHKEKGTVFNRLTIANDVANSYLIVLMAFGWPVFILMMALWIWCFIDTSKNIIKNSLLSVHILLVFGLLVFLLVEAFFLPVMLESCTYYSALLLLTFGFSLFASNQTNRTIDKLTQRVE